MAKLHREGKEVKYKEGCFCLSMRYKHVHVKCPHLLIVVTRLVGQFGCCTNVNGLGEPRLGRAMYEGLGCASYEPEVTVGGGGRGEEGPANIQSTIICKRTTDIIHQIVIQDR